MITMIINIMAFIENSLAIMKYPMSATLCSYPDSIKVGMQNTVGIKVRFV